MSDVAELVNNRVLIGRNKSAYSVRKLNPTGVGAT